MELWIRSQDRHNLLKIDRLDVDDCTIQANFKVYDDSYDYIIIGRYKTNKRALEVLDEIQNIIRAKYTFSLKSERAFEGVDGKQALYILEQMGVYEMPEE